jgi:hypothetical protein
VRLLGAEALQIPALCDPLRLDDVGGRGRGGADGADLSAADQVRECGEGFLDVGRGVDAVDLVEVDVVGLQAA